MIFFVLLSFYFLCCCAWYLQCNLLMLQSSSLWSIEVSVQRGFSMKKAAYRNVEYPIVFVDFPVSELLAASLRINLGLPQLH